jgi:hypothetical protein
MAVFTHSLSTNNYGPAKLIVATSAANGTHTTLASAMSAAVSGDTIFLRDSVTESVTLTPGVNIVGWQGQGGAATTPSITGTLTMSGAGTSNVTNSAFAITVSGSAASILNIFNCYLNFSNNTGISFTSSSSSAAININNCTGNLGTTGIGIYSQSSPGLFTLRNVYMFNTGASTTASSNSAGTVIFAFSGIASPLSTSSGGVISCFESNFNTSAQNVACLTTAGTGSSQFNGCVFVSGTASCISIGSGTTVTLTGENDCNSSNTNVITGAGSLNYTYISYSGTSSGNNVTTQTMLGVQIGKSATNTFTPVLNFGGATTGITYAVQSGTYRLVSNMCFFDIEIILTSVGSATGAATITGMPFPASASVAVLIMPIVCNLFFTATYTSGYFSLAAGASSLGISQQGSGVTPTATTNTNFGGSSALFITGFYFI